MPPVSIPSVNRPVDRVTAALERARRENPAWSATGSTSDVLRNVFVPRGPAIARPPDTHREVIVYTTTRVQVAPNEQLRARLVVVPGADPRLADAVHGLRSQVVAAMRKNGWSTLAVVSPSGGEGRTLCAINLAMSVAIEPDQTCLLVDADLRHPTIHDYFGLPAATDGLANFLTQYVPIESLLINPGVDRLVLLPGGRPQRYATELFALPRMADLVSELRARYTDRFIVFDVPALLKSDDARTLLPLVDAVLLVAEEGRTTRYELARARGILRSSNVLGVVLNKSRATPQSSGGWFTRLFNRRGA
ncbi:MAG: hypothetical protein ABIU95_00710 [Burkholderiales bacterium]